jgi:hypothetical protein
MPGPSRQVTYRLRTRPGADKKYRIVIQRRFWFFFWKDWYPVDNAVRSLHHEFIQLYERMMEINQEVKDAESWVESTYKLLDLENKREGKSAPFKDQFRAQEAMMPDVSSRFKEVQGLVTQGQGRQRPGGGSRTMFIGPTSSRFDVSSLNRTAMGEEFNADHVIPYRQPQPDNQRHKNKHGNQNQQQQNQNKPDQQK